MTDAFHGECRYFVTYSGVKLPLKLSQPLEEAALNNRNTYFRAWFDEGGRMTGLQKMVYGEVEMQHRYEYYDSGALKRAEITDADEETTILEFEDAAQPESG
jgi:hypothetical protein